MRGNGQLVSARGLVPAGHVGWAYRTPLEFRRRAAEYLADGLACGDRVELVAPGGRAEVEDLLCSLPGGRSALDAGTAVAVPLSDFYDLSTPAAAPPAELHSLEAARRRLEARQGRTAAGYAGRRVIVDATDLARTPADREGLAAFEALIDASMATSAGTASALCAFDAAVLGEAAGELTCLHPWTDPRSAPFRLFADGAGGLALAGEVDFHGLPLFEVALRRVWAVHDESELQVDLAGADFLGHRALLALEHAARVSQRTVVLRRPKAVVARIVDLIGAPALRVEDR